MSNKAKGILLAVILAGILAAAFIGYRVLSARYTAEQAEPSGTAATESAQASAAAAEESAASDDISTESVTEESAEDAQADLPEAPDFRMLTEDGEEVRLSDFQGKPTVVNFWASWCPPCKNELPHFEAAYKEYGEQVNFVMLDLADGYQETEEAAKNYVASQFFTFPVYFDSMAEGAYAYGTFSIPVTVVITADGRLYTQRVGVIPTREMLDEMFVPLLEGAD